MSRGLSLVVTVGGALVVGLVAMGGTFLVRRISGRHWLRGPSQAGWLDSLVGASAYLLPASAAVAGAAALLPSDRLPPGLDRAWLVGAALGLASGIPFFAERRRLRRQLRDLPRPDDPLAATALRGQAHAEAVTALAGGDGALAARLLSPALENDAPDAEAMRLRALAAVSSGEDRVARAYAIRASQVDPLRWDAAVDAGLALCQRGRFREGLPLLRRAVELSGDDPRAELALAQGEAMAGRLRDAVHSQERSRGGRAGRP
jgi:tetratricopeptide (TPR) repeat protein